MINCLLIIKIPYFADDGALSWEEFRTFFADGVLSEENLRTLFSEIDTHNSMCWRLYRTRQMLSSINKINKKIY